MTAPDPPRVAISRAPSRPAGPAWCPRRIAVLCAVAGVLIGSSASAQVPDSALWVTNGPVKAIAKSGNTIYIGGSFDIVGPQTGGGAAIDAVSGELPHPFARVAGRVLAVIPDGAGGWFVGGRITGVGGQPRSNLAHILADGSVAAWSPDPNSYVEALALWGNTLYAAGYFTNVGGQERSYLVAIDATTGAVTNWMPGPNNVVYALAATATTVFAVGAFDSIGGVPRMGLAALDAATGAVTPWDPNPDFTPRNGAIAVHGANVYVSGGFSMIGGQPRFGLAAIDAETGAATAWDPNPDYQSPMQLVFDGNTIYVGGAFSSIGGQPRNSLAAVDDVTGAATAWDPDVQGTVDGIAMIGNTVYAGGQFADVGGEPRNDLVAVDAASGAVVAWAPNPNGWVHAMAASGNTVYAGGDFMSVGGWVPRLDLAALDATTGIATAWDPNIVSSGTSSVSTIALLGGTVYVGGAFNQIGGQSRVGVAALDSVTGAATSWDAHSSSVVRVLLAGGGSIYAGGSSSFGGQIRHGLAALDPVTGAVTSWNPAGIGSVYALAASGNMIIAGGSSGVEALDSSSAATIWSPPVIGIVQSLAADGATIYAGGTFSSIGGQARSGLAALDAATGGVTAWDPGGAGSSVEALAISGTDLYAGGHFNHIGGQDRSFIAALDPTTGLATAWNPGADGDGLPTSDGGAFFGNVLCLASSGTTVYAGGNFSSIASEPTVGVCAIPSDATTPTLLSLARSSAAPGRVELWWYAAGSGVRSATVYRRTPSTDWRAMREILADGSGLLDYVDTDVIGGARYGYRVEVLVAGASQWLGETWVDVPRVPMFALVGARPNPAVHGLKVAFSLPDNAPAQLELIDIAGRLVVARDVGSLGAGSHVVDVLGDRNPGPGVYMLRLVGPSRSAAVRAVISR